MLNLGIEMIRQVTKLWQIHLLSESKLRKHVAKFMILYHPISQKLNFLLHRGTNLTLLELNTQKIKKRSWKWLHRRTRKRPEQ